MLKNVIGKESGLKLTLKKQTNITTLRNILAMEFRQPNVFEFILGGVGAAVGVWFFAHRHGQLRGLVNAAASSQEPPNGQKSA